MSVHNEKDKAKWTSDGRHWYFKCYYKDIYGCTKQYKSGKFKKQDEAKEAEQIFLARKKGTAHCKFSTVAADYFIELAKIQKASTVYTYKKDYNNHIKLYFENYYIDDINIPAVRQWHSEMVKKGLSINYLNKIQNILKSILDFAIVNYGLKVNYVAIYGRFKEKKDTVVEKSKIRYITHEEFNQFISNVDDMVYKTFFTFAYYTGCRKGEIFALNWKDIDFTTNIIKINKTLNEEIKGTYVITSTKNNINREIVMSKHLRETMILYKDYMESFTDFKQTWFIFGGPIHLSKTTVDRRKHIYFEKSGVHEITMHEFRHSHVSLLANEYIKTSKEKNMKIDIEKFFLMMSSRMGHSIEVMKKTYMHLFPTVQDEIVDLLDNL